MSPPFAADLLTKDQSQATKVVSWAHAKGRLSLGVVRMGAGLVWGGFYQLVQIIRQEGGT